MNFVFRTQRMFVIPIFSFGPPGRVWYLGGFFFSFIFQDTSILDIHAKKK